MVTLQTALMAIALAAPPEGETVLLDFYADWCGPCQQMDPLVRKLDVAGYPIRRVNFDQQRSLAARYGVDRLPTFVMVVGGRVVDRVVGATSYARLEQMCRLAQTTNATPASVVPAASEASSRGAQIAIPPVPSQPSLFTQAPSPNDTAETSRATGPQGWRLPAQSLGSCDGGAPKDSHLIAATVRLRIEDADGNSCGSGTIIDTRHDEALILTCGHLFRDSKGKGRILVDTFGHCPAEGIPGRLISYSLDRDVALVSIRIGGPTASAKVAPPGYKLARGDRVVNVGCSSGGAPTARHSSINAIDKFTGPSNLTVAGLPVQGRSGGGLFSAEGLLIGVCFAANPTDNEGLYAALDSIHTELDRANLSYVYRPDNQVRPAGAAALVAVEPPSMPRRMPEPAEIVQLTDAPSSRGNLAAIPAPTPTGPALTDEESDALEEIRSRASEGAEVICVIRSRRDPQARSEIIILEKASDEFLRQLASAAKKLASGEPSEAGGPSADRPPAPQADRRGGGHPILEWSASGR